jgi:hypothetical protein
MGSKNIFYCLWFMQRLFQLEHWMPVLSVVVEFDAVVTTLKLLSNILREGLRNTTKDLRKISVSQRILKWNRLSQPAPKVWPARRTSTLRESNNEVGLKHSSHSSECCSCCLSWLRLRNACHAFLQLTPQCSLSCYIHREAVPSALMIASVLQDVITLRLM